MALSLRRAAAPVAARPMGARLAPVRPVVARATGKKPEFTAPEVDVEELKTKATTFANDTAAIIKDKWEKTEDKPAAVLTIGAGIVALSLGLTVVNVVDKIPIVSDLIELVGIGVTGFFAYRYLTVGPDRDELFVSIRQFAEKIYGKKF